jgi:hypothetical protein
MTKDWLFGDLEDAGILEVLYSEDDGVVTINKYPQLLRELAQKEQDVANKVTLEKVVRDFSSLDEDHPTKAVWAVKVEAPDGDMTEELYETLDEAIAYVKDVADRPLRPFDPSSVLQPR